MQGLILMHATAPGLAELRGRACAGLLPVTGRALAMHTLDAMAATGIRRVTLAVAEADAPPARRLLGDGQRWGLRIDYLEVPGSADLRQCLERSGIGEPECLVARADVLRTPFFPHLLDLASGRPGQSVAGLVGGSAVGAAVLRRDRSGVWQCPQDSWLGPGNGVEGCVIEAGRAERIEDVGAYHRANLDAAADLYPGLILPARHLGRQHRVARHTRVDPASVQDGPMFVGARSEVRAGSTLSRGVVLQEDVFVDRDVVLEHAVVLPHTYVGQGLRLRDVVVWGDLFIQVSRGVATRVADPILLGDTRRLVRRGWRWPWSNRQRLAEVAG